MIGYAVTSHHSFQRLKRISEPGDYSSSRGREFMEIVTGKRVSPGVQVGPTDITKSTGKEKKVSGTFRHEKDDDIAGVPGLCPLSVPVLGGHVRAGDPGQARDGTVLSPFCEHCQPVTIAELATSFRIFKDAIGQCWRCFMPLTCDHAIVIDGTMQSCRVRSREIHAIQAGGE